MGANTLTVAVVVAVDFVKVAVPEPTPCIVSAGCPSTASAEFRSPC